MPTPILPMPAARPRSPEAPASPRPLLDRWFQDWLARAEPRWRAGATPLQR